MLKPRGGHPHVTLPGTGDRPRRNGLNAHRSSTLTNSETTMRDGIPVTTPSRTLEDLPADRARRARRQAEFDRLPLSAKHPTDRTRSELERDFLGLCRRHHLAAPEVNVRIEAYTVDFLWRDQRLIVEIDGYGAHSGRQAFTDDRVRDARLALAGHRVQRFDDWQLQHEPRMVVRTVRALLTS
jgi:very-short-patch-repair endonuclease